MEVPLKTVATILIAYLATHTNPTRVNLDSVRQWSRGSLGDNAVNRLIKLFYQQPNKWIVSCKGNYLQFTPHDLYFEDLVINPESDYFKSLLGDIQ